MSLVHFELLSRTAHHAHVQAVVRQIDWDRVEAGLDAEGAEEEMQEQEQQVQVCST